MGFFSDLKEDLSQAVNDLKPDDRNFDEIDEIEETEGAEEEVPELKDLLQDESEQERITIPEEVAADGDASMDVSELQKIMENADDEQEPMEELPAGIREEPVYEVEELTEIHEPMEDMAETSAEDVIEEGPSFEEQARAMFGAEQEEIRDREEEQALAQMQSESALEEAESVHEEDHQTVFAVSDREAGKEMTNELETLLDQMDETDHREAPAETAAVTEDRAVADEVAVITSGMKIKGDITSDGSMDVIGEIEGNLDLLGKLNVTGTIVGNSKAFEVYAENAKITGELRSEGSVKIGQSSVVVGNIFATSAVIAGAVKGDIDVHGSVVLDTSAIVMGNIKSKSVQINNGAVIEGMCSQVYADVNPTSFFEELKKSAKAGK